MITLSIIPLPSKGKHFDTVLVAFDVIGIPRWPLCKGDYISILTPDKFWLRAPFSPCPHWTHPIRLLTNIHKCRSQDIFKRKVTIESTETIILLCFTLHVKTHLIRFDNWILTNTLTMLFISIQVLTYLFCFILLWISRCSKFIIMSSIVLSIIKKISTSKKMSFENHCLLFDNYRRL